MSHAKEVNSLAFSPDGTYAITGSNDNTAVVWQIKFAESLEAMNGNALVQNACSRLDRNLTQQEWSQFLSAQPYRKTCPDLK
jgi:WD40 repeat protein